MSMRGKPLPAPGSRVVRIPHPWKAGPRTTESNPGRASVLLFFLAAASLFLKPFIDWYAYIFVFGFGGFGLFVILDQLKREGFSSLTVVGQFGLMMNIAVLGGTFLAIATTSGLFNTGADGTDAGNGGNGYCSSNSDCSGFGARHCSGGAYCSTGNLCYCPLSNCPGGSNCRALSCSSGCDANTFCDRTDDVCLFKRGGLTTD